MMAIYYELKCTIDRGLDCEKFMKEIESDS